MVPQEWNEFHPSEDFEDSCDDPDEYDLEDATESDLVPCPRCGRDVYEDSPQCPYCGDYIVVDTHPFSGRPWWWIALGLSGVVAVIAWLLM